MLDDDEFKHVMSLLGTGTGEELREREFGAVLREYERITGFHETNINAVWRHKLDLSRILRQPVKTQFSLNGELCHGIVATNVYA